MSSGSVVASVTMVGGPGGSYQEVQAWKVGNFISKITVFWQEQRIRGAYIWMYGQGQNDGATFGDAAGSSSTFEFQSGELITSMSLWQGQWENSDHIRAGHISFTTNQNRSFSAGPGTMGSETKVDVQSGYLVGVEAYTGDDINKWGFVFLKPLINFSLTNVNYIGMEDMGGIEPVTLDSLNETNNSNTDSLSWTLQGEKDETVSWEFSTTDALTTTFGFEVSAGIPEVAEVKDSFQWQVSDSSTRSSSQSQETTLTWSTGGTLQPGEQVIASAVTQVGTLNGLNYTGTVVIKTQDGSSYSYAASGTYSGTTVTEVQINVQTNNGSGSA